MPFVNLYHKVQLFEYVEHCTDNVLLISKHKMPNVNELES